MIATTEKARALLAAATPGPWSQCGADRGGCTCGLVWSIEFDVVVATATGETEGGTIPDDQRIANAAIIAAAPELLATLCDDADASERRAKDEANARIELSHDLYIRLELAEAGAAAMREALGFGLGTVDVPACVEKGSPCEGPCECDAVEWRLCACGGPAPCTDAECPIGRALATDAGRAILDLLERAEAERDANRTAAENAYAAQLAAESERDALRVELSTAEAEMWRLAGLVPELPPLPPDGDGLPRYGLRWNGPKIPLSVPMDDGYWTPWHLAKSARLQSGAPRVCDGCRNHWVVHMESNPTTCAACGVSGAVIVEP